jgi:aspartyl-tRNA(Asn)/glutamyl-tRNA(Gln) amidotransferase subunit A
MTEFTPTISGLQRDIAQGHYTARQALTTQRASAQVLNSQFLAAVNFLPDDFLTPCATGRLAGAGLAHKDIFNLPSRWPGLGRGSLSSAGCGRDATDVAAATVIERLRGAGAAHLATLAMAEYACGSTGDNPNLPRCVNPLDAAAVVGGSSSGSAVAVASGMVYGSLGTDTAGSVRIPAATCGVLGLKTTHGLLPLDGVFPLAPSLDSVGVLARTADDTRQILLAACDDAGLEAEMPPRPVVCVPGTGVDGTVFEALHSFARTFGLAVHTTIAQHTELTQLAEIVLHAQAAQTHRSALLECALSPGVEAIALPGLAMPPEWLEGALARRAGHLSEFVQTQFRACNILVLPALPEPVPAWREVTRGEPEFDVRKLLGLHRFMGFVNYLGLPALVVPIARDRRGLPISVQLIGRPFHELTLLRFAADIASHHFCRSALQLAHPLEH